MPQICEVLNLAPTSFILFLWKVSKSLMFTLWKFSSVKYQLYQLTLTIWITQKTFFQSFFKRDNHAKIYLLPNFAAAKLVCHCLPLAIYPTNWNNAFFGYNFLTPACPREYSKVFAPWDYLFNLHPMTFLAIFAFMSVDRLTVLHATFGSF